MSLKIQLTEKTAPLSFLVLNSGILTLNNVVKVTVYNATDGSVLLASTSMTMNSSGCYYYLWTHGRTVKTHCLAFYSVTGLVNANTFERFTLDTEENTIETSLGDAV